VCASSIIARIGKSIANRSCIRVFQLAENVLLCLSLLTLYPAFSLAQCDIFDGAANSGIALDSSLAVAVAKRSKPVDAKNLIDGAFISARGSVRLCDDKPFHVHAMLPGKISKDNAVVGKYYRKGELLAVMESAELVKLSSDYWVRMEQNEMSIRQSESSSRLARLGLDRIKSLVKEGIMAEKDLRQAEEDYRRAGEDFEDLNEQRVRMENEFKALTKMYGVKPLNVKQNAALRELLLVAPNSGVVVAKNVTLGDRVNPDEAAYTMVSIGKVKLGMVLPITDRSRIAIGQSVTFSCNKFAKQTFSGVIDNISTPQDSLSKDFSVTATIENPQASLVPGMVGNVKIFVK